MFIESVACWCRCLGIVVMCNGKNDETTNRETPTNKINNDFAVHCGGGAFCLHTCVNGREDVLNG